mmetsp:Transcript_453/g.659  ORF Transcript_453/g.659 Transcript_453/m.659 type:complete len:462 (+) Transcript_453:72-1457(+)
MPPRPCPPHCMVTSDPVNLQELSSKSKEKIFAVDDKQPILDFRNATEWISFVVGSVFLTLVGAPVGIVVFTAVVWEAFDRGFNGGFVDSGKELTGFIFARFVPWLENRTRQFNIQFVKRPEDAYMMNCIVGYGVFVPIIFLGCAWHAYQNGMNYWLLYAYHVLRIGPYFMNFAYVYTLCHKEGHTYTGLYSKSYNKYTLLRHVFNWWIGMFYGVLPATFAYGHSINHHKYNNAMEDVITTSDKPRDNFANWVAYLPRYFLYAINISTIYAFAKENNWKVVNKVFLGSVWFFAWVCVWAVSVSPMFAFTYVAFPFFEAGVLLAAVNWSWHAFVDPTDPSNEYVQSITILDGPINVLNEDSHVVHHQYPGTHWTNHPNFVDKHWEKYIEHRASVFRGTHAFEIFGMSVARDYDALAKKFVDIHGERVGSPLTHTERVELIKSRLRACWWGPRLSTNQNTQKQD